MKILCKMMMSHVAQKLVQIVVVHHKLSSYNLASLTQPKNFFLENHDFFHNFFLCFTSQPMNLPLSDVVSVVLCT